MSDAGKETLATRLVKEGQSTLEQLQRWGTDLLEAMAYLVDVKGVFHRDIKPPNLLLDARGNAWVTDFGLAKCAEGGEEDLTGYGEVPGSDATG